LGNFGLSMLVRPPGVAAPALGFIFLIGLVGLGLKSLELKLSPKRRRRRWRDDRRSSPSASVLPFQQNRARDAADQLRIVMKADLKPQPLLNNKPGGQTANQ